MLRKSSSQSETCNIFSWSKLRETGYGGCRALMSMPKFQASIQCGIFARPPAAFLFLGVPLRSSSIRWFLFPCGKYGSQSPGKKIGRCSPTVLMHLGGRGCIIIIIILIIQVKILQDRNFHRYYLGNTEVSARFREALLRLTGLQMRPKSCTMFTLCSYNTFCFLLCQSLCCWGFLLPQNTPLKTRWRAASALLVHNCRTKH